MNHKVLKLTVPVRTVSELNQREDWRPRYRRNIEQQRVVIYKLREKFGNKPPLPPFIITLTRLAPREFDSDNLAASFKHVQDAVAFWLGLDDGDKGITWLYRQERAGKDYGVRIEIELPVELHIYYAGQGG